MEKREALFIGGEWVSAASGKVIEVINPYTEEVMGAAPEACEADVDEWHRHRSFMKTMS